MEDDKIIERDRYNRKAQEFLSKVSHCGVLEGADSEDPVFRAPYIFYQSAVKSVMVSRNITALELGAGTGRYTAGLLNDKSFVYALDISNVSLQALKKRLKSPDNLCCVSGDIEKLPFQDEMFDLVTSAGTLSYGDPEKVMFEVKRVLKPGGFFICVDSLNHNPIYRFNRWLHYLRGIRSLSTLKQMPTIYTIEHYKTNFQLIDLQFFGSITWIAPLLKPLVGKEYVAKIIDQFDKILLVRKSAFKFVLVVKKNLL